MKRFCLVACVLSFLFSSMTAVADFSPPMEQFSSSHADNAQVIAPLSQENVFLFGTTLQAIRQFYVNPISDDTITENAARGMLSNLDPHSDYLDAEDFQDLKTMTSGSFSGIGVEITAANGAILVISPIDGSPADKAGIKAGDYIVKINGVAVDGMSLTKAMNMMRGKKGEQIKLTVIRKGEENPLDFTVTRDDIKLKDVRTQIFDDHYAYLRVSMFEAETGDHLKQAILDLQKTTKTPIYGVILDLRNNPGGVVTASVDVSNLFLDASKIGAGKPVVYTKGRFPQSQYTGYVTGTDLFYGLPMVVLINSGTASAAEIVAGALQDYHRAILVGIRSFGKGSVQTVFPLPGDKTAIKLTTALYYTPDGRSIQALGISPDVKVNSYSIPDSVKPLDNDVIREGDLIDHLDGDSSHPQDLSISQSKTDGDQGRSIQQIANGTTNSPTAPLDGHNAFYRDFQLYSALNILMALHAEHYTESGS